MNGQVNGLDVRVSIHIRISNANEKRIPIEKIVFFIFGCVGVERLVVGNDAPKGILGKKIKSRRKTAWEKRLQ